MEHAIFLSIGLVTGLGVMALILAPPYRPPENPPGPYDAPGRIFPLFPWIRELKAADPEWWASYSKELPSVAYREFAKRNPSHPFSERVRRELA